MMDSLPPLRYSDCWWIVGILSIAYLLGVQWGIQLAHTEDVSQLRQALDAWKLQWEEYVEPVFETVYDLAEDSLELQKLGKLMFHQKRRRRWQQWEPEIPRFSPPDKLKLPKPIINVGFPKAGTSSIFSFFHCNGLKGQHWFCCEPQDHPAGTEHQYLMSRCILQNIIDNTKNRRQQNTSRPRKLIFEGCGDYDFYSEINGPRMFQSYNFRLQQDDGSLLTRTQTKKQPRLILPQHHYLEEIHEQFPNATFLLNLRPTQQWVDSVMRWGTTLRQELPNEFVAQDSDRGFSTFGDRERLKHYGITNLPPQSVSDLNATLAYVMDYHSEYIRDFVRRHPSHTLIEVDITHKDAGQLLADAFGLNETCWEHRNQNNKTGNDTDAPLFMDASNLKIRLRKQAARTKRAELNGDMKQSFFSRMVDNRELDQNDDQENEKRQGIQIHDDTMQGRVDNSREGLEDVHVPLNIMMTNAHDEFEMYDVGDVTTEARNARKELYQQRLKQARLALKG